MRGIMDGRKIFLARLSQGAIGEENAHLLGSLLVARIAQAAMSRQDTDSATRVQFFCYIDEFHHFVTPSIAAILSGTRKYGVGITLAHQEIRQVKSRSEDVMSAILANAHTRIIFRVGDQDARALADGLSFFDSADLMNLGIGEAIVRVERPSFDSNLKTVRATVVHAGVASRRRAAAIQNSRAGYARPRAEIEEALRLARPERTRTVPAAQPERRPAGQDVPAPTPTLSASTNKPASGRGGSQHKYLQSLVQRLAEDRGFTVTIEKEVLHGHGYVDVALEREGLRVGCEISITTRTSHETENLTKVLAAGFDYAVLISSDARVLDRAARALHNVDRERIRLLAPDELIGFLDELTSGAPRSEPARNAGPTKKPAKPLDLKSGAGKTMLMPPEAAVYLGLAVQTLAKMRVSGEGPLFSKLGRLVVYDRADLDEWIANNRRKSTSDRGKR